VSASSASWSHLSGARRSAGEAQPTTETEVGPEVVEVERVELRMVDVVCRKKKQERRN
jgi:hypothetical protein